MDWLSDHADMLVYISGGLLTFLIWNVNQGNRIKEALHRVGTLEKTMEAIRTNQSAEKKELVDELRRIGEKLAHIEGFLHRRGVGQIKK